MGETDFRLQPNRRHLLAGLGLSFIGVAAHGAPAQSTRVASSPTRVGADLQRADASTWSAYVGQDFTIPALSGVTLRLIAVQAALSGGTRPADVRPSNFYAVFESTGRAVPDGNDNYVMQSRSVAPLTLFLGRRVVVSGRQRFVATFN